MRVQKQNCFYARVALLFEAATTCRRKVSDVYDRKQRRRWQNTKNEKQDGIVKVIVKVVVAGTVKPEKKPSPLRDLEDLGDCDEAKEEEEERAIKKEKGNEYFILENVTDDE
uniref:Uncharacterized protein n=1 Tax=Trichogramma kaykai TaxID=54128 RepID=A0ABD2VVA7_9HYME